MPSRSLSIVLPCYNEEANIQSTVESICGWFQTQSIDGEVIVVNDGSKDRSGEILRTLQAQHPQLVVCTHETNQGYGSALRTGLDRASKPLMGYMDSDRQFHVQDFEKLFPYIDQYRFVTGRRRKRADPFLRKCNAKLFALLNVLVLHIWVRDINCAMKLWHKDLWPTIRPTVSTGALFNAEMFYRLKLAGIPWKQVMVEHYPRQAGTQTGAKLSVILRMFRDLWRLKIHV